MELELVAPLRVMPAGQLLRAVGQEALDVLVELRGGCPTLGQHGETRRFQRGSHFDQTVRVRDERVDGA